MTLDEKRELGLAARDIRADPAFKAALERMKQSTYQELMICKEPGLRQTELCSMLRVLEIFPVTLKQFIDDYNTEVKKGTNG